MHFTGLLCVCACVCVCQLSIILSQKEIFCKYANSDVVAGDRSVPVVRPFRVFLLCYCSSKCVTLST